MHNKVTMEMSICQAENGFFLDELVKKLAEAFATDTRGFDVPYFQQFEQSEMLSGWSFDAERQL
jgi:hypothetical protein